MNNLSLGTCDNCNKNPGESYYLGNGSCIMKSFEVNNCIEMCRGNLSRIFLSPNSLKKVHGEIVLARFCNNNGIIDDMK